LQREGELHSWAKRHYDRCDDITDAVQSHFHWRVGYRHAGFLLLVNASTPFIPLQPATQDHLVVTLSVNPVRIAEYFFQRVLRAVAGSQSLSPNRVIVNVPDIFVRTGKRIIVPNWIFKVASITVNLCRTDYGPITKLLPTIQIYSGLPLTRIFVVDDDREHWPNTLELMVRWGECFPGAVIANWGVQAQPFNGSRGMGILDFKASFLTSVLGNGGYMLRAGDVTVEQLSTLPPGAEPCATHDDPWISNILSLNNVPMLLVPGYPCAFWETHYGDDFDNGVHADTGQTERYQGCNSWIIANGGHSHGAALIIKQQWSHLG